MALNCNDPIATEKFYTRYFGFRRARLIPLGDGNQIVFIKNGDAYLELFKAEGVAPAPAPRDDGSKYAGFRHIAFMVDDVDAKLAELSSDKRIMCGPLRFDDVIPGWYTVWVADPDGNIVEISQGYVDQEYPPGLGLDGKA
jgi:glyoxylase I family protein